MGLTQAWSRVAPDGCELKGGGCHAGNSGVWYDSELRG